LQLPWAIQNKESSPRGMHRNVSKYAMTICLNVFLAVEYALIGSPKTVLAGVDDGGRGRR
jgi:hypothetical protein